MPERITTFDKTCIGRRVRMRIDREPEPGEAPERVWTGKITHFDPDQPREPIIVGDISPGDNTPRRINVNRWIVEWDD